MGSALYYNRLSISLTLKAAVVSHPAMSNSVSPLLTQHLPYIMRALKHSSFPACVFSTAWTPTSQPSLQPPPTVMEIPKTQFHSHAGGFSPLDLLLVSITPFHRAIAVTKEAAELPVLDLPVLPSCIQLLNPSYCNKFLQLILISTDIRTTQ